MLDGYLKLADTEIINHARLQAYIEAGLVTGYEHIEACGCPSLTARSLSPCCLDVSDGAHASTPDDASFAVGFDPIDVNVTVRNVDDASDQVLASQWDEPNDRGWLLVLRSDGLLSFRASEDGTATTVNAVSTEPVPSREFTSYRARFEPIGPPSLMTLDGSGDFASTPDLGVGDPARIVGDLALVWHGSLNDWTPATTQNVVGKYAITGNQKGYFFQVVTSTGLLRLVWSTTGANDILKASTVPTGFIDGTEHWIAATLDVNNGAAGNDVKFWTSTDGITWSQLGATVTTAGVTSVFPSSAASTVGATSEGGTPVTGRVGHARIISGALDGTVVANPDFTLQAPGTTSFVDSNGRTWNLQGDAAFINNGWRVTFYTRPALSNFWVPLGSTVEGEPWQSMFNSTAPVRIGAAA